MGSSASDILSRVPESEWAVAYRKKQDGAILNSQPQKFYLLKNTLRYWCADPFPVEAGERTYVFFEAYDRMKRKGVIAYREIGVKKPGGIHIILEEPFHLSYPCVYREKENWYLIPESREAGHIVKYRARHFPDLWEQDRILIDGIEAVDTTVLPAESAHFTDSDGNKGIEPAHSGDSDADKKLHLILYLWERRNKGTLQVVQRQDKLWRTICQIDDPNGRKRPAGKVFRFQSSYYRPSQLCTRTYGEAIILNRVAFTDQTYTEEEYRMITKNDICLDIETRIKGVHTYNSSEAWEVIDVELEGFRLVRFIGIVPRIYQKIKKKLKPPSFHAENLMKRNGWRRTKGIHEA
ncbi:MAG: hypothetical protein K0Q48_89 [Bacillota bacterium]|nr:hypothetical protein [Bacillota bacterium]